MFKKLDVNSKFILSDLIDLELEKTISKNIVNREDLYFDLISLGQGEMISKTQIFKDNLIYSLEGDLELIVDNEPIKLVPGEPLYLERLSQVEILARTGAKLVKIDFEGKLKSKGFVYLNQAVEVLEGQVANLTLGEGPGFNMAILALDKGEKLNTHAASGDAFVYVVEGSTEIFIDGEEHILNRGESIIMPKNIPHSVKALEPYRMLLIVLR